MLQRRLRREVTSYLGSLTSLGQCAWVLGAPHRVPNTSVPSTCPPGSSRSPTGVRFQAGVEGPAERSYALPACQTLLRSVFTEIAVVCSLSCSLASRFIFHHLILERHLKLSLFLTCDETQDDGYWFQNKPDRNQQWMIVPQIQQHGKFIRPNQVLWENQAVCRSQVFWGNRVLWGNQAFRWNRAWSDTWWSVSPHPCGDLSFISCSVN